jgi:hypothetical protein
MANNTQKSYDLAEDGSTVLKFRGHPNYDAFRVENDDTEPVDVTVYVNPDDELDNVSTGDADTSQVDSADVAADANYGTTASARTVLVELAESAESDTGDGPSGTVYGHNASDPAENATAFANR